MTREEEIRNAIDTIFPIPPSEKGRKYEQALMATGFEAGVRWADEHPKSPWISVEDDLPCNHEELLKSPKSYRTKAVIVRFDNNMHGFLYMTKIHNKWEWYDKIKGITHWMPIPKSPN